MVAETFFALFDMDKNNQLDSFELGMLLDDLEQPFRSAVRVMLSILWGVHVSTNAGWHQNEYTLGVLNEFM